MEKSIFSATNSKLLNSLIFIFVSLLWISCKPSEKVRPPVTSITYTDRDMKLLNRIFYSNIAAGKIRTFSTGTNEFTVEIPSMQETMKFHLPIKPVILDIPGLFAEVKLNRLRIRDIKAHWDEERKALRLRSRFYDKRHGAIGYYKLGFIQKDISLKVKDAVLDIFIIPRVESGRLTFAPLEVELSFYEGNVPFFIKPILYQQIDKTIEESKTEFQAQFDAQESRIVAMIRNYFVPEAKFENIKISDGIANLTLKYK